MIFLKEILHNINTKSISRLDKIDGDKALTIFKRYEYSKEFLRSLVRRGSSKINFIMDIKTKDGYIFRIKIIGFNLIDN